MHNTGIFLLTFLIFFAAALLGMRLRMVLPEHHLSTDTKDSIRIWMGLVATMAALVLGLLVSSTKGSFDTERGEITQVASKVIYLDRLLANYGPEAVQARAFLKTTTERALTSIWSPSVAKEVTSGSASTPTESLFLAVQQLTPQSAMQHSLQAQAVQIIGELGQIRWLLFEQQDSSISMPLLIIVTAWLAIIFASTGLFAPTNTTVVVCLMLAALSVAGAIFLILELDQPFTGLIRISSEPMRVAVEHLGH